MIVYSKSTQSLRLRALLEIRKILEKECRLQVHEDHFHYNYQPYPLQVLVFEHPRNVGHFDPRYFTIGINRNFLFAVSPQAREAFLNTLRHELAHYLCWINFGDQIPHHSRFYRKLCRSYGWGEEVYLSEMSSSFFENTKEVRQTKSLLGKVEKLFNLAHKAEGEEAQSAALKAQELIEKYNLDRIEGLGTFDHNGPSGDGEMVVGIPWEGKRANQKIRSIADILGEYMVFPCFSYGDGIVRLEIMGRRENVEVANYIAHYFDREFDRLWKAQEKFRGITQRNSFFRGLSEGFIKKLKAQKGQGSFPVGESELALQGMRDDLSRKVREYRPELTSIVRSYRNHAESERRGHAEGQEMEVREALKDASRGKAPQKNLEYQAPPS